MAYSRWGSGSKWYTFYNASSPQQNKGEQIFTVMVTDGESYDFTYCELKSDINKCLARANGDSDLEEDMKSFMLDVEEDAKKGRFR